MFSVLSHSVVSDYLRLIDCSLPGSCVHGIFQARILEWVAIHFSSPEDLPEPGIELGLLHCRQILYHLSCQGSPCLYIIFHNKEVEICLKNANYAP